MLLAIMLVPCNLQGIGIVTEGEAIRDIFWLQVLLDFVSPQSNCLD